MVVKYSSRTGTPAVLPTLGSPVPFTPVITAGSAATSVVSESTYTQIGQFALVNVSVSSFTTSGPVAPTAVTISLASNMTIGGRTGQRFYGSGHATLITANPFDVVFQGVQGANVITIELEAGNSFTNPGSGRSVRFTILLPIVEFAQSAYTTNTTGLATSARAGLIKSYEEGVFTPIFSCSTTAPTLTYTTQTAAYTKTGRMVFFTLRITVNTVSSVGAGNIVIAGFPYLTAYGNLQSVTIGFAANWQFQAPVNAAMNANGSIELFFKGGQQNNTSSLPAASFQAGSDIAISGFYMAAS